MWVVFQDGKDEGSESGRAKNEWESVVRDGVFVDVVEPGGTIDGEVWIFAEKI